MGLWGRCNLPPTDSYKSIMSPLRHRFYGVVRGPTFSLLFRSYPCVSFVQICEG
ncbi:hypothetical protein N665_2706s0002 [Sinapis alba]|nr:hypothetical protein N665_2706s0002 [Sinapis alba]